VGNLRSGAVTAVVADDSIAFRTAFADFLAAIDVSVVGQVASAESAVATAKRVRPDVIFVDARMPGMGGIAACRQIRASCPGTRVVLMSANPANLGGDPGTSGATAVVHKLDIVQSERLVELVKQLMRQPTRLRSLS
jgi:DNA-binding NarL/FixJ family response regulator